MSEQQAGSTAPACDWCGKRTPINPAGGIFDPCRWLCSSCECKPSVRAVYEQQPGQDEAWINHLCNLRKRAMARLPLFGGEPAPLASLANRMWGRKEASRGPHAAEEVQKRQRQKRTKQMHMDPEWLRIFGLRLKVAREAAGMTQEEVRSLTGISIASMSGWERGHGRPRPGTMDELAELFGVTTHWLLTGHGRSPIGGE